MGRLTLCKEAKVTLCQLLILLILVAARNVVSAELTHILRNRHRQSANTLKRLEVMYAQWQGVMLTSYLQKHGQKLARCFEGKRHLNLCGAESYVLFLVSFSTDVFGVVKG